MTEIKAEYPYASVEETVDAKTGRKMFAAYCDSDCADEIDFIPSDADPDKGDIVIWFAKEWALKNIDDGRVVREQFGYVWKNEKKETFANVISDETSVGGAANANIIQVRDADAGYWRSYKE